VNGNFFFFYVFSEKSCLLYFIIGKKNRINISFVLLSQSWRGIGNFIKIMSKKSIDKQIHPMYILVINTVTGISTKIVTKFLVTQ